MFKVGENRKFSKFLPGLARISILKAESFSLVDPDDLEEKSGHDFRYCVLKCKGHDHQKTTVKKRHLEDGKSTVLFQPNGESWDFEFDIPHYAYQDAIEVEMWSTKFEDFDEFSEAKDILLGTQKIPIPWIVNGFGMGYGSPSDSFVVIRLRLVGFKFGAFSQEVDVKLDFNVGRNNSKRSRLRWISNAFNGTYVLDISRSSSREDLYLSMQTPWVLRNLEERPVEETLDVKISKGGDQIQMTRKTETFIDEEEPMLINELFQSVKTFFGTVVEKRLYWDFTNMAKIVPDRPYPNPVLMCVTRTGKKHGEVIEAWDLSDNGSFLTQVSMIDGSDKRFTRGYIRVEEPGKELVKAPKVVAKDGYLIVAVMNGQNLLPDEESNQVSAYAAVQVVTFDDKETSFKNPLDMSDEQHTRMFENNPNPNWNQVFRFKLQQEKGTHQVLAIRVWNRSNDEDEVLIGSCRVPVPWIYNGFGMELGPRVASFYQGILKLKPTDDLNPSRKVKYRGGRVQIKIAYEET